MVDLITRKVVNSDKRDFFGLLRVSNSVCSDAARAVGRAEVCVYIVVYKEISGLSRARPEVDSYLNGRPRIHKIFDSALQSIPAEVAN
jgi:hypothetical protein